MSKFCIAGSAGTSTGSRTESLSTSSRISTTAMIGIMERLKYQCHRSSTQTKYYGVWKNFNQFYIRLDRKPGTWEERLYLYVTYLVDSNKKSSTVASYISAIKVVLLNDGVELNENRLLLAALTRACKLKNDHVRTRFPIQKNLLQLLIKTIPQVFKSPQPYLTILYQAMMSTAYFGLFRVGEITLSEHIIKADDVYIGHNKNKLRFVLHSSKTHGHDVKPQVVRISSRELMVDSNVRDGNRAWNYCPFKLLKNYVAVRKIKDANEPLFILQNRAPVTGAMFRSMLKTVLQYNGLNPQLYSGHSFKIRMRLRHVRHANINWSYKGPGLLAE